MNRPVAWICLTCGRFFLHDDDRSIHPGAPEHFDYRGVDLGTCGSRVTPIYMKDIIEIAKLREGQGEPKDENS